MKALLSGNQLKIIAMISMTLDHIGLQLLPQYPVFRVLGRLALPIYAYMIAEGCRYTHDRKRYLLRLLGLGALCQAVYFFATGSVYMCILITFSLSVGLIYLSETSWTWFGAGVAGTFFLCTVLPDLLEGTDYAIDYGLWGVMLPVFIYYGKTRKEKLSLLILGLALLGLGYGSIQWWALLAVPLVAMYSGQRGKRRIGKLFYVYYPLHLVVIEGIRLLIN